MDSTLTTTEEKYHLYMLEIELVNRIYKEEFKRSEYKFALIAHCLRDFRDRCDAVGGEIESLCRHCTKKCLINIGTVLLKKANGNEMAASAIDSSLNQIGNGSGHGCSSWVLSV